MFAFVLLRSSWWLRMDVLQLSQTHFVLHMKVPFCMFDVLRALGLAGGSSGWWNPWATNSWSKSWEIIHKNLLLSRAGDGQPGKKLQFHLVLVSQSHTTPRINHCQKCQGILRSWWSLQKALTALPVMQPCQAMPKKAFCKGSCAPSALQLAD